MQPERCSWVEKQVACAVGMRQYCWPCKGAWRGTKENVDLHSGFIFLKVFLDDAVKMSSTIRNVNEKLEKISGREKTSKNKDSLEKVRAKCSCFLI